MSSLRIASGFLLLLAACDDGGTASRIEGVEGDATIFAVAGDFMAAGIATTVSIPSLVARARFTDGIASADPVVRAFGGKVYIINRFAADRVVILDGKTRRYLMEIATGAGSNPQDVAVRGNEIYVAALNSPGVLVLDTRARSRGVSRTIDLSHLDPDGKPDCGSLYLLGSKLFVVCGLADPQFKPRGRGVVAVVDLERPDAAPATFELVHPRPFGLLQPAPDGGLFIATVPVFAEAAERGCLERIEASGQSGGCAVENRSLGGYAASYRSLPDGSVAIAVTSGFDAQGPKGRRVSWSAGAMPVVASAPDRPLDLTLCPTGHLVVAEAGRGLRVFAPDGAELTTAPIPIGLPPVPNGLVCL